VNDKSVEKNSPNVIAKWQNHHIVSIFKPLNRLLLSCGGITFATFIANAKSFLSSFLQHVCFHCQQW
jgi:hypothetical protein